MPSKIKVTQNPLEGLKIRQPKKPNASQPKKSYKNTPLSPKSFRLSNLDIDRLKDLTDLVSDHSGRMKVNDTLIMKALILLGKEIEPTEILQKIKEIKVES